MRARQSIRAIGVSFVIAASVLCAGASFTGCAQIRAASPITIEEAQAYKGWMEGALGTLQFALGVFGDKLPPGVLADVNEWMPRLADAIDVYGKAVDACAEQDMRKAWEKGYEAAVAARNALVAAGVTGV